MGKILISTTYLMLILSCVESCFLLRSLYVIVPELIPPGYQVAKVETVGCDAKSAQLTVKDPSFTIKSNGVVIALRSVSVGERGRIFSVSARDKSGRERKMEVHLVHSTILKRHERGQGSLNRSKRPACRFPTSVVENYEGNYPILLEKLVSDPSASHDMYFTIEGEGVDTYATGVFSLDRDTGDLFLLKALDREEFPEYNPLGYEKTNDLQLLITAQNVASLNGSSATWQSIPVNVNVEKVDAGSLSFGLLGIMTMLCPVVLLLMLFLLLAFFCLTKREKLQLNEPGRIPLISNIGVPGGSAERLVMWKHRLSLQLFTKKPYLLPPPSAICFIAAFALIDASLISRLSV